MRARPGSRGIGTAPTFVLAALCAAGLTACGRPSTDSAGTSGKPANAVAAESARSRIFIDPATGQLREPTAEEVAAAARAESRDAPPARSKAQSPREIQYPDGTVGVLIGEESLQPLQACVRPDGSVDELCGHGGRPGGAASEEQSPRGAP